MLSSWTIVGFSCLTEHEVCKQIVVERGGLHKLLANLGLVISALAEIVSICSSAGLTLRLWNAFHAHFN